MSHDHLENLSLALVREYLSKKGYKQTLATLQEELPIKPTPTTRAMLTADLGLTKLVSKNSKSERPWDTLLEIFTEFMYIKHGNKEKGENDTTKTSSSQPRVPQTLTASNPSLSRPTSIRSSSPSVPSSISPTSKLSSSVDRLSIDHGLRRKSATSPTPSYPVTLSASIGNRSRSSSTSSTGSISPKRGSMGEMIIDDVGSDDEMDIPPTKTTTTTRSSFSSSSSVMEHKSSPFNKPISSSTSYGSSAPPSVSLSQPMSLSMGTPITLEEAHQLKKLIFGANALQSFTDAWSKQGFYPKTASILQSTPSLGFALVQAQGGPCGMLAVVQAYMLKELLFGSSVSSSASRLSLLTPSPAVYRTALINALSDILWQAGDHRSCRVAVKGKSVAGSAPRKIGNEMYRPDGLIECINIISFDSLQNLKSFFNSNIGYFTQENGTGCVCFFFSVLLSRGLNNVEADRDDPTASMIGSHSYCTQEMVNLALTGRAHSNVFDGVKDMDGTKLRGITQQSAIGFLSLFEHYGYIEVGSYYKNPQFPIWVLCSESHYSVLFGLDKSSINAKGVFDLYYYDELANQNEEIKLTIDTSKSGPAPKSDDLEPPINECIRTKWGKHARIDWNGSEPIL